MATYRVTDPETGRTVRLTGDSPPTEQELEQVFTQTKQGATLEQAPTTRNLFESPMARILFPQIGGAFGTAGGMALGGMAGGGGAIPGGLVGGGTGAGIGASTRQLLARLTGGGPRTAKEAISHPIGEATLEVASQALGPFGRAISRGAGKVLRPEMITKEIQPITTDRVVNGLNAFKEQSQIAYEKAIEDSIPRWQSENLRVSISEIQQPFRDALVKAKVISPEGQLLEPLLGTISKESNQTRMKLLAVLNRLSKLPPSRGFQQGTLPMEEAIELKQGLDELLDFDPNVVRAISKRGRRLIMGLRTSLSQAIGKADETFRGVEEEYHGFRSLYDAVQPALKDQRIESTIAQLQSRTNRFTFRKLAEINDQLDPDLRFINEALDDLAAREFAREPELFAVLPLAAAGLFKGAQVGGPIGGVVGALLGAQAASGRSLAAGLRGAERVGGMAQTLSRGLRPEAAWAP